MPQPLVTLVRGNSTDEGTFGALWVAGKRFCFTGELPWRDNANRVSCIPTGRYRVAWVPSPAFKRSTYLLADVKNRSGVRVHAANFMGDVALGKRSQLLGCIALGYALGTMEKQAALLRSAPAVLAFERLMEQRPFTLEIEDA